MQFRRCSNCPQVLRFVVWTCFFRLSGLCALQVVLDGLPEILGWRLVCSQPIICEYAKKSNRAEDFEAFGVDLFRTLLASPHIKNINHNCTTIIPNKTSSPIPSCLVNLDPVVDVPLPAQLLPKDKLHPSKPDQQPPPPTLHQQHAQTLQPLLLQLNNSKAPVVAACWETSPALQRKSPQPADCSQIDKKQRRSNWIVCRPRNHWFLRRIFCSSC